MKKILLLFDQDSLDRAMADPKKLSKLLEQNSLTDTQYLYCSFNDLLYQITNQAANIRDTKNGHNLDEYDAVYMRRWQKVFDHALACAIYMKKKGTRFIDTEAYKEIGSFSKLSQYFRLWEKGLPVPNTLFSESLHLHDLESLSEDEFAYPLVIKSTKGTRGGDNYLAEDKEQLHKILNENEGLPLMIQTKIENDGDYRVFVVEDKVELVIFRSGSDDHRNNTSQGADAAVVDNSSISEIMQNDAIAAAKAMGRDIAGVDLVIDSTTNAHYFFEVNRSPQVEDSSYEDKKAIILARYLER